MKFGSENDFNVAITELKWIEKTNGKLADGDIITVSRKYNFPPDFLKEGLKGLSYPWGQLISQSKWYPIFFSWMTRESQYSKDLYRLQIDYHSTRAKASMIFFLAFFAPLYLATVLVMNLGLSLLQVVLAVGVPASLGLVGLFFQFRSDVSNKKSKVEEFESNLKRLGLERIVKHNARVIDEHISFAMYAGRVFLQKLNEAPDLSAVPLGIEEHEVKPRLSRIERLLVSLRIKHRPEPKKEKVPVFYVENPYLEYAKRLQEAFGLQPDKDQPEQGH